LELCNIRRKKIPELVDEDNTPLEPFREGDVAKAIKKLNSNKSSDEFGLAAEHLKYGVEVICPALTK
jgi:hypothetical protein